VPACCTVSYEKTQRPCPRCSKWICHSCGVISGELVCGDCSIKPPERPAREGLGGSLALAAAVAGGVTGGMLGGLLCVLLSILAGPWAIGAGLLPGIGARLGVHLAAREFEGCSRPILAAAATLPGFFLVLWISVTIGLNQSLVASGKRGGLSMFDPAVFRTLFRLWDSGYLAPTIVGMIFAIVTAIYPLRRR
jgi:hypothetical protein